MRANRYRRGAMLVLTLFLAAGPVAAQVSDIPPYNRADPPGDPPAVPDTAGEVQGRGPVHEAFAQPGEATPRPSPAVTKQPPEPIQELPPEQKPDRANVAWIPGYWAWDEERTDYIWVSGFWRVVPPGRKWVPGYWTQVEGGWQWVSGLWASSSQEEIPYVDTPPESLENGPTVPPPQDDYFYSPGCWIRRDEQWLWQPGFWSQSQPGWVYCPPRYCWTPRGCLFVSAYWDRPLEDRGVLFAPVYFPGNVWSQPGFCYRPSFAVGLNALISSLWVRNGWGCYAFGDFYGQRYLTGYQPWAHFGQRHRDPLFSYYRHNNPSWQRNLLSTYRGRVNGTLPRPPRTLAAQQRLVAGGRDAAAMRVVQPLSSYRSERFRLAQVSETERVQSEKVVRSYRQASVERNRGETRRSPGGAASAALPLSRVPNLTPSRAPRTVERPGRGEGKAATPAPATRPPTASKDAPGESRRPVDRPPTGPRVRTPEAPQRRNYTPQAPRANPTPRSITPDVLERRTAPKAAPPAANPTPPATRNYTPQVPRPTPPPVRNTPPVRSYTPASPRYTPPTPRVAPRSAPQVAPRGVPRMAPRPAPRAAPAPKVRPRR